VCLQKEATAQGMESADVVKKKTDFECVFIHCGVIRKELRICDSCKAAAFDKPSLHELNVI